MSATNFHQSDKFVNVTWHARSGKAHEIQELEDPLFYIAIETKSQNMDHGIQLSMDGLNHEFYSNNEIKNLRIEERESRVENNQFFVSQNIPNPWNENTVIHYSLPHAGIVNFKIYDVQGQLVSQKNCSIKRKETIDLKSIEKI